MLVDSHGEPGGEGQCVPVEAAVRAGQRGGNRVLCSGTNHDEEGVFGRLCREKHTADWLTPETNHDLAMKPRVNNTAIIRQC